MTTLGELTSHADWFSGWVGALIGGLIGAVVGSSIPLGWSAWQRSRERKGEVLAMQVELRVAHLHITTLLEDEGGTPLFRLPLSMFHRALPKLIGDRKLRLNDIGLLVEYVNRVEELNRRLDYSASMNAANLVPIIEVNRTARAILQEKLERHGNQSLYDGAWSALLDVEESIYSRLWRWICDRWQYGAL
jgi:hypothetical protein